MAKTVLGSPARRRLEKLGLVQWVEPCESVLRHFAGIERVVEDPENYPLAQVQQAIAQAQTEQSLLEALQDLTLWRYRARHGGVRWNPLETPLSRFEQTVGRAIFWEEATVYPDREAIRRWLRERRTSGA